MRGAGDRWLAGEPVDGVTFALNDPVEIAGGIHDGVRGVIVLLLGLTPEPSYLVTVRDVGDVRVRQSALHRA